MLLVSPDTGVWGLCMWACDAVQAYRVEEGDGAAVGAKRVEVWRPRHRVMAPCAVAAAGAKAGGAEPVRHHQEQRGQEGRRLLLLL